MCNRSRICWVGGVMLATCPYVQADLYPRDDPIAGKSPVQALLHASYGAAPINLVTVDRTSPGEDELPILPGWQPVVSPTTATRWAAGDRANIPGHFGLGSASVEAASATLRFAAFGSDGKMLAAQRFRTTGASSPTMSGLEMSDVTLEMPDITNVPAEPPPVGPHHTPAPGAILLGAIGLGMVGWVRRRLG